MEENELMLTKLDKTNFLETARWGMFLAIVGFIFSGLIVLIGLTMFAGVFGELYPGFGGGVGIVYVLMSLLYIFPSLFLYRFSSKIKQGIQSNNHESCSEAYSNLRKLFLFMGVLTIIGIGLYVMILLFIIMGGVMGGML